MNTHDQLPIPIISTNTNSISSGKRITKDAVRESNSPYSPSISWFNAERSEAEEMEGAGGESTTYHPPKTFVWEIKRTFGCPSPCLPVCLTCESGAQRVLLEPPKIRKEDLVEGGEGAEVWAAFVPKCVWVGECVCGWVGEPECVCVLLVFLSPFLELSVFL